jgi:hypothetical protein
MKYISKLMLVLFVPFFCCATTQADEWVKVEPLSMSTPTGKSLKTFLQNRKDFLENGHKLEGFGDGVFIRPAGCDGADLIFVLIGNLNIKIPKSDEIGMQAYGGSGGTGLSVFRTTKKGGFEFIPSFEEPVQGMVGAVKSPAAKNSCVDFFIEVGGCDANHTGAAHCAQKMLYKNGKYISGPTSELN